MKAIYIFLAILCLTVSVSGADDRWAGDRALRDTLTSVSTDTQLLLTDTQALIDTLSSVSSETKAATDTLSAILNDTVDLPDTLSAVYHEARKVARHNHSEERWFGPSGDQSGDDWALGGHTATNYRATTEVDSVGAEVKIIGIEDTAPLGVYFDLHRAYVSGASYNGDFYCRLMHGSTTAADAVIAGDYTEFWTSFDTSNKSASVPVEIQTVRVLSGVDKMWLQVYTATDAAWLDIKFGGHWYTD